MRLDRLEMLNRVDIAQPLSTVVRDIAEYYRLGQMRTYRIIPHGYDDLNVLLTCEHGQFVAKLFNKTKRLSAIEDHVRVQRALTRRGAPVPRILTATNGEALYCAPGRAGTVYGCVSGYFAGESIARRNPTTEDIHAVTRFLAGLHRLPFRMASSYDSWGTLNLPQEYARKHAFVSAETRTMVAPLAEAVATMRFGRARRAILHGDLQRKHVLRDNAGAYCILDFGCMVYSYPVVDLAIFLALFCLDGAMPAHADTMLADVLRTYRETASLPARHETLLGTLIRATWASYLLTSEYLLGQGDQTPQTCQWHRFARRNLVVISDKL